MTQRLVLRAPAELIAESTTSPALPANVAVTPLSTDVVRAAPNVLIVAHRNGFVTANAGIDQSNIEHAPGMERVLLLPDAPSIDANEITDKGYVNQRLALQRRAADVERLFAARPDADVIALG